MNNRRLSARYSPLRTYGNAAFPVSRPLLPGSGAAGRSPSLRMHIPSRFRKRDDSGEEAAEERQIDVDLSARDAWTLEFALL